MGKAHGACPEGAGPSPAEDPTNPWPGNCGSGRGADAFTSGFEGPWTANPLAWDNSYFANLLGYEWTVGTGPGGHSQWSVGQGGGPTAPAADGNGTQAVMMLTSDIALLHDPSYNALVNNTTPPTAFFSVYHLVGVAVGAAAVPPLLLWQFPPLFFLSHTATVPCSPPLPAQVKSYAADSELFREAFAAAWCDPWGVSGVSQCSCVKHNSRVTPCALLRGVAAPCGCPLWLPLVAAPCGCAACGRPLSEDDCCCLTHAALVLVLVWWWCLGTNW